MNSSNSTLDDSCPSNRQEQSDNRLVKCMNMSVGNGNKMKQLWIILAFAVQAICCGSGWAFDINGPLGPGGGGILGDAGTNPQITDDCQCSYLMVYLSPMCQDLNLGCTITGNVVGITYGGSCDVRLTLRTYPTNVLQFVTNAIVDGTNTQFLFDFLSVTSSYSAEIIETNFVVRGLTPTPEGQFSGLIAELYKCGDTNPCIVYTQKLDVVALQSISVSPQVAQANEDVTFTAQMSPPGSGGSILSWSGDGKPATGTGTVFTTRWSTLGIHTVTAYCGINSECGGTTSVNVPVVKVDLDGDFNHDGNVNATDLDDPEEDTTPGLIVGMNFDDDNGNSTTDKNEDGGTSGISGENDLVKIHLALEPSTVNSGDVILGAPTTGNGNIKVWKNPAKGSGNLILDSASPTDWKKTWTLSSFFTLGNVPSDLYVEGFDSSSAYGDVSLILRYENPAGTFICDDKLKLTVAKAFAGRRMFGWGDEDVDGIAASIQDSLSYETVKNQSVSKTDAINNVPARFIWYTFSHGMVAASGVFKAVDYGDPFFPSDVPAGADYILVFLNGCCSAQIGSGSNADAFKTAFNANAYVGWKTEILGPLAAGFASEFFSQLNGTKTITQAINAALGTYTPGGYAYTAIANNIRVIGDENLVVDLSP